MSLNGYGKSRKYNMNIQHILSIGNNEKWLFEENTISQDLEMKNNDEVVIKFTPDGEMETRHIDIIDDDPNYVSQLSLLSDTQGFNIGTGGSLHSKANSFYIYDRTNGKDRMVINNTGKVCFGTNTPNANLHLHSPNDVFFKITNDATANGFDLCLKQTTNNAEIRNRENSDLLFFTNNIEHMRLRSSGELEIYGDIDLNGNIINSNTGLITFGNDLKLNNSLQSTNSNSTYVDPRNTNVPQLRVDNTNSSNNNAHAILGVRTANGGGDAFVSFDIENVNGWSMGIDNTEPNAFKISNSWSNVNGNNRFKLDNNGNLEVSGYVRGGYPGQLLNSSYLDNTSLGTSTVTIDSNVNKIVAYATYNPISSSSKIKITFDCMYQMDGYGDDSYETYVYVNGVLLLTKIQKFIATGSGGGCRSGTLYPIMLFHNNSSFDLLTVTIYAKRTNGNDNLYVYKGNGCFLTIEEIQN